MTAPFDVDALLNFLYARDGEAAEPGGVWPATGRGVCTTAEVRAALLGDPPSEVSS